MLIAVGLVVLMPAYYVLKAKGYHPPIFLWLAILVSTAVYGIVSFREDSQWWINAGLCASSLVVLALSYILPTRKGAPGLSYLRIEFSCPHCKQTIKFDRELEGLGELCPKCDEIVTVPSTAKTKWNCESPPVCEARTGRESPEKIETGRRASEA